MSKFKVGDRVRVTSKDSFDGDTGEVTKVHLSSLAYDVKFEGRIGRYGFDEDELFLAERTESDILKEIADLTAELEELRKPKLPTEAGIYAIESRENHWSQPIYRLSLYGDWVNEKGVRIIPPSVKLVRLVHEK